MQYHRSTRVRWTLSLVCAMAFLFAAEAVASAYPWMIRHEYMGCTQCHLDPSGAGVLTLYGRAQSEVLLRTSWSGAAGEEDPSLGGLAFGLVPLPEKGLRAQADVRALYLHTRPPSPAPPVSRAILMQADAWAGAELDQLRAAASLGYAHEGALAASVTHGAEDRVVSRQHWIGATLGEGAWLARAGRMNLPFGVRTLEHSLWVRSATRTDTNAAQQHGVAVAYAGERLRAEAMAVVGNLQLAPPELRERGYAGYVELAASPSLALGASSLVLHTDHHVEERVPAFRQAHGIFARAAPARQVVILAEADLLVTSPRRRALQTGATSMLQVDVEPLQGVHVIGTGEMLDRTLAQTPMSWGAWLSAQWFFLPHVDVRIDGVWQSLGQADSRIEVLTLLGQLHAFL